MQLSILLQLCILCGATIATGTNSTGNNTAPTTGNNATATTSTAVASTTITNTKTTTLATGTATQSAPTTGATSAPPESITCNNASYAYSPTRLSGVLNQTAFSVSITYLGSADSRALAANSMTSWEIGCGRLEFNSSGKFSLRNMTVYRNSTADTSSFRISANNVACVLNIYTSCGTNLTSAIRQNAFKGISGFIYTANMTLPITSADGVAAALNASKTALADPNVPAANKLSTIASLASNLQTLTTPNSTSNTILQSSSNEVMQQLSNVVSGALQSELAPQAASVIDSVQALISTGSTSASSVAQAASVLLSVLGSVANTSSISTFSVASGNSVANSMASILQSSSSSNGNASIVSSLDLLSKIAGSQATLANPIAYADASGLVLISAAVSYPSNLASVLIGNNSINTGSAFTSLLSTIATTKVTSRAVSVAINPYSSVTPDSVNSSRTGVFQFSLFDDSNNPISVQNLASNFSMTFAMTPSMWTPAFPNATVVPACQYWNITQASWQSDGCYFDTVNSNTSTGICKCNHLTAFSVSLASIAPNVLNPVSDAANASHAGFIYLCAGSMAALWITSVYYSWYNNRRLVLRQNGYVNEDFVAYKVRLQTDSNPRSSTTARTYITIHGSLGRTECVMFAQGMKAGVKVQKTMIALNVGSLQSVTISHDGTGGMTDWKVSQVSVKNIASGNELTIDTSFAVPQAGIEVKANSSSDGESSFFRRFHSQVLVNMQDRHLWLSTITAPAGSRFSHTERLAVCFLLLFGNMGLGFWFHKSRSFTQDFLNVIIVAVITSGLMLAITLPLMFILRFAHTGKELYDEDMEQHSIENNAENQKGFSILWRYLAWIVTGMLTLGGLALCALSALNLDANNVSALTAALQSAAISLAESLFISSPLMAIGRSWWSARKNTMISGSFAITKKPNKNGGYAEASVVQASSVVEQQWNIASEYPPSFDARHEPPMTSNPLSSAIVPSTMSRNRTTKGDYSARLGV